MRRLSLVLALLAALSARPVAAHPLLAEPFGSAFSPALLAEGNHPGLTADLGATTLHATTVTGFYRFSAYIIATTDGGAGDTLPATTVSWTEGTSGQATSALTSLTVANAAISGLSAARTGTAVFFAQAGTNIQYSTSGYVAGTGMAYAVRVRLELLN